MIPLCKPYLPEEVTQFAHNEIDRGYLSMNLHNSIVEEMLEPLTGCKYNLLTNSGTTANVLINSCLEELLPRVQIKRELRVPNNCYIAAYNPFAKDLILSVTDTDLNTWNMVEDDIYPLRGLLLVVHNLGNPVNVPEIKRKFKDILIVEDNCEGFLGSYEGKPTGSEAWCSSISFFGNKLITSGEGGCFCTNDEAAYELAKLISRQGLTSKKYIHQRIAYNFRLTNVQAALLYGQLRILDEIKERRREIFEIYDSLLKDVEGVQTQKVEDECVHSHWIYGIRIIGNTSYDKVEKFFTHNRIETRPLFYPIHYHEHFRFMDKKENAILLSNECVLLPTYIGLRPDEQKYIVEQIIRYIKIMDLYKEGECL